MLRVIVDALIGRRVVSADKSMLQLQSRFIRAAEEASCELDSIQDELHLMGLPEHGTVNLDGSPCRLRYAGIYQELFSYAEGFLRCKFETDAVLRRNGKDKQFDEFDELLIEKSLQACIVQMTFGVPETNFHQDSPVVQELQQLWTKGEGLSACRKMGYFGNSAGMSSYCSSALRSTASQV